MKRTPTEADLTPGAPVPDEAPDWSRTDEGLAWKDSVAGERKEMLALADKIDSAKTSDDQWEFITNISPYQLKLFSRALRAAARPTLVELERAEARAKA